MKKPHLAIISPALAKANNGNWQTASRWARFLRERYRTGIALSWSPDADDAPDAMIALHARRSAASVAAFAEAFPERPIVLALTGTDLYRDILHDDAARRSVALASRLVVLQEAALDTLAAIDPAWADKARVIYQSAPALIPAAGDAGIFDVIMIGHLRAEKDPATYLDAARLLDRPGLRLLHVGNLLDPAFAPQLDAMRHDAPGYRWLGGLSHVRTRKALRRCALMAITSKMEGGANVIIEAVRSGVPVVASDIPGNRGMLGDDYAGYFPVGDAAALAGLIARAADDPAFLQRLRDQCARRAPLFSPWREKAALLRLMDNLPLVPRRPAAPPSPQLPEIRS